MLASPRVKRSLYREIRHTAIRMVPFFGKDFAMLPSRRTDITPNTHRFPLSYPLVAFGALTMNGCEPPNVTQQPPAQTRGFQGEMGNRKRSDTERGAPPKEVLSASSDLFPPDRTLFIGVREIAGNPNRCSVGGTIIPTIEVARYLKKRIESEKLRRVALVFFEADPNEKEAVVNADVEATRKTCRESVQELANEYNALWVFVPCTGSVHAYVSDKSAGINGKLIQYDASTQVTFGFIFKADGTEVRP